MRYGWICEDCKGIDKCTKSQLATALLQEILCPGCEGKGCCECKKIGQLPITNCPLKLITADVWEIISLAELFEKGLPPVAGGVLDQAKCFVDAARFVFAEQSYWKNKLGILS